MAYNKVVDKLGNILIDLTNDTVTEDDVRQGKIFHNRSGDVKIGTLEVKEPDDDITVDTDLYGDPTKFNDVIFFDALGRIVARYSIEEARNLTELPPLPVIEEEDLIGVCWNHTLEDLKYVFAPTVVGACYKTTDELTHIEVDCTYQLPFTLELRVYGSSTYPTTIYWGDGEESQTTVTGIVKHTYTDYGIYTIKLRNNHVCDNTSAHMPSVPFGYNSGYFTNATERIRKLKISKDYTRFNDRAFGSLTNLRLITFEGWSSLKDKYPTSFPEGHTNPIGIISQRLFTSYKLKSVSFPRGAVYMDNLYPTAYLYSTTSPSYVKYCKVDLGGFGTCNYSTSGMYGLPYVEMSKDSTFTNIGYEHYNENNLPSFNKNGITINVPKTNIVHLTVPHVLEKVKCIIVDVNYSIKSVGFKVPPANVWNSAYLSNAYGLKILEVPNNVTRITSSFPVNIRFIMMDSFEVPPTLSSSSYIPFYAQVVVNDDMLDTFLNTSGWSSIPTKIISRTTFDKLIEDFGDVILND